MERITLKARDGYIYTNGESYGITVYLGSGDARENWHEITIEEYNEILAKESENFPI